MQTAQTGCSWRLIWTWRATAASVRQHVTVVRFRCHSQSVHWTDVRRIGTPSETDLTDSKQRGAQLKLQHIRHDSWVDRVNHAVYLCTAGTDSERTRQELSYRKQIARQLRTQYVEGIYRPNYPVTLKSRLRITEGHWKRNHSIDHTRLTIGRIIWCWILSCRDVTLKTGLGFVQGHLKWHHLLDCIRVPIHLP